MSSPSFSERASTAWILVGLYALSVVASLMPGLWWPCEVLGNFAVHQAVAGVGVALVAGLARVWPAVGVALGGASIAGAPVVGLLAASPGSAGPGSGLRVSVHNVLSTNPDPAAAVARIAALDSELVVVLEVTEAWRPHLEALSSLPHQHLEPRGDNFGIALLSSRPLHDVQVWPLGDPAWVSVPAVRAEVALPEGRVQVVGAHLFPPIGARAAAVRSAQVAQLAASLGQVDTPTVLLGDFNTTPTTRTHRTLSDRTGLHTVRRGQAWWPTWPSASPPWLRIPIDDILVSEHWVVRRGAVDVGPGSDHAALVVELTRSR